MGAVGEPALIQVGQRVEGSQEEWLWHGSAALWTCFFPFFLVQ